ncbi:hypothetical protein AAFF_G00106280 [Aldrovandia affinis]|uniref:Uncharacterized protein n=1 Tax=Aldrovandia affinis TaxID=143900 RepID=A0AAD7T404_9TELE|nr:hypothetical protein AAFF_G00106280 [Aldrovandia affinis]
MIDELRLGRPQSCPQTPGTGSPPCSFTQHPLQASTGSAASLFGTALWLPKCAQPALAGLWINGLAAAVLYWHVCIGSANSSTLRSSHATAEIRPALPLRRKGLTVSVRDVTDGRGADRRTLY